MILYQILWPHAEKSELRKRKRANQLKIYLFIISNLIAHNSQKQFE